MVHFSPPPVGMEIVFPLLILVITAALYDFRYRRIPNWVAVTGALTGVVVNTSFHGWAGLRFSFTGLGVAFGAYLVLYILHAMGAGDVKLMGAVGSLAGLEHWFYIFLCTALAGGVVAVAVILAKGRLKRTFWNVGFVISELLQFRPAYLKREELDVKSEKATRLPHGTSIAMGTILYLLLNFSLRAGA